MFNYSTFSKTFACEYASSDASIACAIELAKKSIVFQTKRNYTESLNTSATKHISKISDKASHLSSLVGCSSQLQLLFDFVPFNLVNKPAQNFSINFIEYYSIAGKSITDKGRINEVVKSAKNRIFQLKSVHVEMASIIRCCAMNCMEKKPT